MHVSMDMDQFRRLNMGGCLKSYLELLFWGLLIITIIVELVEYIPKPCSNC